LHRSKNFLDFSLEFATVYFCQQLTLQGGLGHGGNIRRGHALIARGAAGHQAVASQLISLVYDELRRLASHYLKRERPDHTLQPTALVHEAYLRLVGQEEDWQSRSHFIGVAARQMREILVDYARSHQMAKRGKGQKKLSLDEIPLFSPETSDQWIALDETLTRLAQWDGQQCRIVELRFFGGLTVEETAEALGVSPRTVKRDWQVARAWLHRELKKRPSS
jgi:RNA polymerase sigma factor (TIGR02999 family)